jgi:hypothetical protein
MTVNLIQSAGSGFGQPWPCPLPELLTSHITPRRQGVKDRGRGLLTVTEAGKQLPLTRISAILLPLPR